MTSIQKPLLIITVLLVLGAAYFFLVTGPNSGSSTNSVVVQEEGSNTNTNVNNSNETPKNTGPLAETEPVVAEKDAVSKPAVTNQTSREILQSETISLPLSGSVPTDSVLHSIPIEEIRRGCFRQDCIPSVDNPEFVSIKEANEILPDDTIGIALEYKGEERFYPFNMLVTREIVNDVVAGDPLLVTYCPLCGTGIVFDRTLDGVAYEFGVSGMLWQSNLLMYNRAPDLENRNLWSQVLGEAVVGSKTGRKLSILPSNVVRYVDWRDDHKDALVLNTGRIGDPYGGDYYGVARSFAPSFDESDSPLDPSAYVFGVEINGSFQAYPREELPVGSITDTVGGKTLSVTKSANDEISITDTSGNVIPIVTGFWFSWTAAHPGTDLWRAN